MSGTARPRSVVGLAVATGVATLACLFMGLRAWLAVPTSYDFGLAEATEVSDPSRFPWLLASALGAVAFRLLWKGARSGPAWVLGFWTIALGMIPGLIAHVSLLDEPPTTVIDEILIGLTGPAKSALLFAALLVPWLIVARATLGGREPSAEAGYANVAQASGGWSRFKPLLFALVLFSLWPFLSVFRIYVYDQGDDSPWGFLTSIQKVLFLVVDFSPFAVCAGLILWLWHERLTINEGGVRLAVFGPRGSLFFAPWKRIQGIELVEHDRGPRTAVVRYRSRLFLPFSLGVHAERYAGGESAIDALAAQAAEHGVPIHRWYSGHRMLAMGWSAIALGILLLVAQNLVSYRLMSGALDPDFPSQWDVLAGLFPLTALHVAAILCVGLGFGLLSGHHRGGSRPVLLVLLMIATSSFPDPLIHWLVWIAIYAILSARFGEMVLAVPDLPVWQWELALGLILIGPAFAALGYYIGVAMGRRRVGKGAAEGAASAKVQDV